LTRSLLDNGVAETLEQMADEILSTPSKLVEAYKNEDTRTLTASGLELLLGLKGLKGARHPDGLVDGYVGGLYRKLTPTTTPAGLFEVEQAGKYNYRVVGGGQAIDIDGYRSTTILEAKYVGDPSRSPFIEGSSIPDHIREKILKVQQDEFRRLRAVIGDPTVPFNSLEVRTNSSAAAPYFKSLMKMYEIPGAVRVVETQVGKQP